MGAVGAVPLWDAVRGVRRTEAKGRRGAAGETGLPGRRLEGRSARARPPKTFRKDSPAPDAPLKFDAASFNPGMQLTLRSAPG